MEWCSIKLLFTCWVKEGASDLIFWLLKATYPHMHRLIWKAREERKERDRQTDRQKGGGGWQRQAEGGEGRKEGEKKL